MIEETNTTADPNNLAARDARATKVGNAPPDRAIQTAT